MWSTIRTYLWPAVAGLVALLIVASGYRTAWPLVLDVGTRDARFVRDFHEPEAFGGALARWTTGDSAIDLPRPPTGAAILRLRLVDSRPPGAPAPRVALAADSQPLGAFGIAPGTGPRLYHLLAPVDGRLAWYLRIGITSDTISTPADPRLLGVVVDQVGLLPIEVPLLPSNWVILWSALLGVLGLLLPHALGAPRMVGLAVASAGAALIAWGVAARALEVLPFVQRIVALLGLALAGVLAGRWLARRDHKRPTTSDQQPYAPQRDAPTAYGRPTQRSLIRGTDLPLLLAVAWWLGPLFQLIMTADGAASVTPAPATLWIGAALATGLLLLGVWRLVAGRRRGSPIPHSPSPITHPPSPIPHPVLLLVAIAALAHLAYTLWFGFQRQGPDFWILFKGAREWVRGGPLYDLAAIQTNHFGHVFKVPPFYGMLFLPFVFQDGERILFFHRLINVSLLAATAVVWLRMWGLRPLSAPGLAVPVLLSFRPFADTLAFGQIDLALLLVLTLALWALQHRRDTAAGVLVALGTLFKVYPVLLLAFFIVKRRWWALAGFALGMLTFNGVAVAVMNWEVHRIYLTEVLPQIGGTTAWVENQTISAFLARLVAAPTEAAILQDRTVALAGMVLSGLAGLLACLLALQPAEPRSTRFALQYGQFLLLMVLVVPAAWMHYETLLFVPYAALLLHLRDRRVWLGRAVALAASFGLVAYGNQWSYFDGTVMGALTVAGVSYKFYGMLLLGGVLAGTLLEERAMLREAFYSKSDVITQGGTS